MDATDTADGMGVTAPTGVAASDGEVATEARATRARAGNPLRRRDFRLLWIGQAISSFGDQFALIALPWLSLVLTGSSLALGGVLALMALPRAALMLIGGVAVDRLSPRRVMFVSNAVRLLAVTALAGLALADAVTLPLLYLFALAFGIADAFFWPAQQAMVPALVGPDELGRANTITQGTTQITVFVGPAVAGIVIAALGSSGSGPSLGGVGAALLLDAVSFVASLVTLALIRGGSDRPSVAEPVVAALRAGLEAVWGWPSLRFVVVLVMGLNLLVVGPLDVGLPVLAYTRLPGGAAAFGLVMSALGAGSLLGLVVAGLGPRLPPARLGPIALGIAAVIGLGVAALALVSSTPAACVATFAAGLAMGYVDLTFITWAQQRIPKAMMGRVFSVILLGSVGLAPLSQLVAGALVQLDLDATLLVSGTAMALLTLVAATRPAVRSMGLEPVVATGPSDG